MFWDLYCAAPERRETCDHSSEAKAFHDYVSTQPPPQKKTFFIFSVTPPTPFHTLCHLQKYRESSHLTTGAKVKFVGRFGELILL